MEKDSMNDLEKYFYENKGLAITKWARYFPIYERLFSRLRKKSSINILEIGILNGGSLKMWKDYFKPNGKVYGIDINPDCKQFEESGIDIMIGNQGDMQFLDKVREVFPSPDIIIDDGSHIMFDEYQSFQSFYPWLDTGGLYIIEDTYTNYWEEYNPHKIRPFIDYAKSIADSLNARARNLRNPEIRIDQFTETLDSLTFYENMMVFEKSDRIKDEDIGLVSGCEFPIYKYK